VGSGPRGNGNAVTHGVYHYLATGELPADVRERVDEFAVDLDGAIAERHGDGAVPFAVRCRRETAISNYAVAMLRARWTGQELSVELKDKLVQGALNCLDKRDAKVADMELDGGERALDLHSIIASAHAQNCAGSDAERQDEPSIDPTGGDAADAISDGANGNQGSAHGDATGL
jgi:hypothetical protein